MEKIIYKTPIEADQEIRLLHKFVKDYNKGKRLGEQVRQQHLATAEMLIKLAKKKGLNLKNPNAITKKDSEFFGVFKDNGASIASQYGLNKKTIDNHLKRLKKAKIAESHDFLDSIRKKGHREETLFYINARFFNLKA